jgi:hypothetical protein
MSLSDRKQDMNNVFTRSRTIAVLAGAGALALAGTTGAVAKSMITSNDLQSGAVTHRVIRDGAVHQKDLSESLLAKLQGVGPAGPQGPAGPKGKDGKDGARGPAGPKAQYDGPDWSIIDRNVIGNGDAYLRSGPSAADGVEPPSGIGSLGIRTGSGTDKAAFGNQVDFVGQALSSLKTVSYYVFTTGENNSAPIDNNLPSVEFEVDPNTASRSYSTLVFVPSPADSNVWTKEDASTVKQWYFTGGFGTDSGCNQTTYCTLAEAQAAAPDATLLSVEITKGRDYAFSGAVDDLQINNKVYDFEPLGVTESNVDN